MAAFDASVVFAGIPLLLAAIGGIVAERSGVLNVGLEGLLLFGCFFSAWVADTSDSDPVGFLAAIGACALLGIALGWIKVLLRADQVVVGIAFNILALGASTYFFRAIKKSAERSGDFNVMSSNGGGIFRIPGLADIPWIGPFFDQHWIAYAAYLLVPIAFLIIFKTGLGVRLRACGEYAEGARATGINVVRMRLLAMGVSGLLAGAGGAYLVLGGIRLFQENMTSGQGYIALAVIILGRWTPLGAGLAALMYAFAQAGNFQVQAENLGVPGQIFQAMPYVITLVAVAISGRRVRPPAEEGRPLYLAR